MGFQLYIASACDNSLPSASPYRCFCYLWSSFILLLELWPAVLLLGLDPSGHFNLAGTSPSGSRICHIHVFWAQINTHSLTEASLTTADHIALWYSGPLRFSAIERLTEGEGPGLEVTAVYLSSKRVGVLGRNSVSSYTSGEQQS